MPVREELRLGASEPDRANRDAFSHQRDAKDRAVAPLPRTRAALGKLVRLSLDVSDMDGRLLQHRSASHGPSVQREGILADPSGGDRTVMGDEAEPVTFEAEDGSVHRLAQLGRALRHGLEDRSDVGWRAGDHLQDLRGRRLPLSASLRALVISAYDGGGEPLGLAVRGVPHSSQNVACGRFSCWHRGHRIPSVSRVRIVSACRDSASPPPGDRRTSASLAVPWGHGSPTLPRAGLGRQPPANRCR